MGRKGGWMGRWQEGLTEQQWCMSDLIHSFSSLPAPFFSSDWQQLKSWLRSKEIYCRAGGLKWGKEEWGKGNHLSPSETSQSASISHPARDTASSFLALLHQWGNEIWTLYYRWVARNAFSPKLFSRCIIFFIQYFPFCLWIFYYLYSLVMPCLWELRMDLLQSLPLKLYTCLWCHGSNQALIISTLQLC